VASVWGACTTRKPANDVPSAMAMGFSLAALRHGTTIKAFYDIANGVFPE
jgi:hypothetical protein